MSQNLENTRKKLVYRSINRGCKETDLLLGKFAVEGVAGLDADGVVLYERFLDEYDGDIYNWLCGTRPVPAEYGQLIEQILA